MDAAMRATVYMGANVPGEPNGYLAFRGKVVTDTDFSLFLDDYVTPRFPGFTVRETLGYWHGKPEKSWELSVLAPIPADGSLDAFEEQVSAVARSYKEKFRQEAVMISYEPVMVEWDAPAAQIAREALCPIKNECSGGHSRKCEGWVSPEERGARDEGAERFDVV